MRPEAVGVGMCGWGGLCAGARQRRVGVKVERPEAEPRTYDLDVGEEWRILGPGPLAWGCGWTLWFSHQGPRLWVGETGGSGSPGISSPRWWGMVLSGHSQPGSITSATAPSGGHAVLRARVLAVSEPVHPAVSACARQRISPSRRP